MPKDKALTNARIIRYMAEEFLAYGYEKASLNRISAKVGITTAGLYKHFNGKEDMFAYLVKDTLNDLVRMSSLGQTETTSNKEYNPFSSDWAAIWTDFIYSHYEGFKLLICCSAGSRFETFEDELIQIEADGNKEYADALLRAGRKVRDISDVQWHMLATAYIHLMFETVRHDMTKEEALEHMYFTGALLYPGWKQMLGTE